MERPDRPERNHILEPLTPSEPKPRSNPLAVILTVLVLLGIAAVIAYAVFFAPNTSTRMPRSPSPEPSFTPVQVTLPTQADMNALARDVTRGINVETDEVDEAVVSAAHSDFGDRFPCYWVDGGWVRSRGEAEREVTKAEMLGMHVGMARLKGGRYLLTGWRCAE